MATDTTRYTTSTWTVPTTGWTRYWLAILRVVVGWWFLHAGLSKYGVVGGSFSFTWFLKAGSGTVLGPITTWFLQNAPWVVQWLVPAGETLIGLGLILGALVRLAAFFGAFLMTFFVVINEGWTHGLVNGDLFGLLLFITLGVLGAGRYYGLDGIVERTQFVRDRPWLRYLLG